MSAPAASHYLASIFTRVDAGLATYVDDVAGRLIGGLTPAAAKMLAVASVMWGYATWRGMVQAPLRDGVFRILGLAIIIGLIDLTTYDAWVADFFMNTPDQLAALVTNAPGDTSIQFLDGLWAQMYAFGEAFWQQGSAAGFSGYGLEFIAVLVWAAGLLACGGAAVLLLMAKMGMHVWLAIGPLFILMAMFDVTRKFTDAWLGQLVGFALIPMLTGAIVKLMMSVLQSYMGDAVAAGALTSPSIEQVVWAVVLCGFSCVLLKQVPSLASGLGGGVAVGTLGAVGAAWSAARGAGGSAKDLMSGKSLSDARSARRHKASNAAWAKEHPGLGARAAGLPMTAWRKLTSPGKNTVAKS